MRLNLLQAAFAALLIGACGSSDATPSWSDGGDDGGSGSGSGGGSDGGGSGSSSGGKGGSSSGSSSGSSGGPAITCPSAGSYTHNGGSCGTELWSFKTGTDKQAGGISLVPKPTTIATLDALAAPSMTRTTRDGPTETTLWELKDVILTELKSESDSDYHLVISDGSTSTGHTMIVEIPYPTCLSGPPVSPWSCFITRARSEVDARYTVSSSPQNPGATITVRGVGLFDFVHGQTGVAPNAIELHPVLQLCFGAGCTPT